MNGGYTNKEQIVDKDCSRINEPSFDAEKLPPEQHKWVLRMWDEGKINNHIKTSLLSGKYDISDIAERYNRGELKDSELHFELGLLTGVIV